MIVKNTILSLLVLLCLTAKAQLTANFTAAPVSGCAPLVVAFIDQSTGSPTQWQWTLGNGTSSAIKNPSTTYNNPGTYDVTLTIQDAANNTATITKHQFITVYAAPTVAFSGTPLTGCFPLPVNFTDASTPGIGTITSWTWDFGDGNSSIQQNPSHTYLGSGNYNVSLVLFNSQGCHNFLTKPAYVKINDGVTANFSTTQTSSCTAPATINFQNLSIGTGALSYQWSFGDGGISTQTNPSHTYAAGIYTVKLIVKNSVGCTDTITKVNFINISSQTVSFTNANPVCINNAVTFTNTSNPIPISSFWNFGDGSTSTLTSPTKTYTATGVYQVKLVADFGLCKDSTIKTITVSNGTTASFTNSNTIACLPPLTVSFTNTSVGATSYNWNFGDGATSTLANPSHTYTTSGVFDVTLTVFTASGCADTIKKIGLVVIEPLNITINNTPLHACAPFNWTFASTLNFPSPIVSYLWNFGDGTTSTLANPNHTFPVGNYTIQLTVTTANGCTNTVIVPNGVVASTQPTANFVANPRDQCAMLKVNFTDLSTGNADKWKWYFGDGGTSTDRNPSYIYSDTGYFSVTLVVCNSGCCDSISFAKYIHINPPIAAFIYDSTCNANTLIFHDKSVGADEWKWYFGDGDSSNIQNPPPHVYPDSGTYTITLWVKNDSTGCTYTKSQTVRLITEKANFTASDTVICKHTAINFSAIGNNVADVIAYQWNFGDGKTANTKDTSHIYDSSGVYSVQLIITNITGCKDTLLKPFYIKVHGPTAKFAPDLPGICYLNAMNFTDSSFSDSTHPIAKWIWNFGDGTIDTLTGPPFRHIYPTPGNYFVSLKVIDSTGCIDTLLNQSPVIVSKPVANFATTDTLSCPNKPIVFSNNSTGPLLKYHWDFGDNTTDTVATPIHNYTADGVYTVKLFITDLYGLYRLFNLSKLYTDNIATCKLFNER